MEWIRYLKGILACQVLAEGDRGAITGSDLRGNVDDDENTQTGASFMKIGDSLPVTSGIPLIP